MRKTLLFACLISVSGCEVCEECTTTTYQVGSPQEPVITTQEVCGKKEIRQAEGVTEVIYSGQTVRSETKCR